MAASSDAEDGTLWPSPNEKHFIDVLVEEEFKGNMPNGQFKKRDFDNHPKRVQSTSPKKLSERSIKLEISKVKAKTLSFFQANQSFQNGMGYCH